ncbi:MAG: hypothetical protein QM723_34255 [Myxococcaceae bacterium]
MRTIFFAAVLALSGCKHSEPVDDPPPADDTQPKPAAGGGLHLFMPPEEGKSRFQAEGCAAKPEEAEKNANTRGGMPTAADDKVTPSATSTGIIVSHDLAHACCLKAESAADIQGSAVVITETLSGTACRCMCSSTLKTAVGLKKGTWQVSLKTVEGGTTKDAWSGSLEVK